MGGSHHGQSPHHSQQQQQQQHAIYPYHSQQGSAIASAHATSQIHAPANNLMDTMLDNFQHRRSSYHTSAVANQAITHPNAAYTYNQNHHLIHSNNRHPLIHHASSSSLSTMSPSLSSAAMSSPSNRFIGAAGSGGSVSYGKAITVHDHDVLSGRGVNIAQHPGNQRFRTLITTFRDQEYCTSYSAGEKRAVALQIIQHIKKLDPPGRFLKRDGRGQGNRGLNGPWDELSEREAIKKTCQALRDCNRQDRQGYAKGVAAPGDVVKVVKEVSHIPAKERAAAAAHAIANEARTSAFNAISVAASNNASTLSKAADSINETSSTVSMSSSTERPRDPEANSSTSATTMAETVESANMNFSPSHHTSAHYQPSSGNSISGRYLQSLNSSTSAISSQNYHLPTSQSAFYYQQQNQQQSRSHNPYQQIHQHHSPQYMSAYSGSNNQNGSYTSATSAASYFQKNTSNHSTDCLLPLSGSQAPLPFQDGLLPVTNSASHGSSSNSHRLHYQQQHHAYYGFPDSYNEIGQQNTSSLIASVGALEHQTIKKQRTEDTDASTGPSEPSPLNSNISNNHNRNNSSKASNQLTMGYDHLLASHSGIANSATAAPISSKTDSSNGIKNKNEESDAFFHDVGESMIGEGENSIENDVNSWANVRNNTTSMHSSDQFHDAMGGF